VLTPKQQEIYEIVKRFGRSGKITALDIGVTAGHPRKKAEKWSKPALKELVKQKKIIRNGDAYAPNENSKEDGNIQ